MASSKKDPVLSLFSMSGAYDVLNYYRTLRPLELWTTVLR